MERIGGERSNLEDSTQLEEGKDGIRGELTGTPLNITSYISKDELSYAAMTNNQKISKALCNKSLFLSHAKTFVDPGRSLGWLSSAW